MPGMFGTNPVRPGFLDRPGVMSNYKDMQASSLNQHLIIPEKESPHENHEIRVITYNIHSCVDKNRNAHPERIAGIVDNLKADIVCLEESMIKRP